MPVAPRQRALSTAHLRLTIYVETLHGERKALANGGVRAKATLLGIVRQRKGWRDMELKTSNRHMVLKVTLHSLVGTLLIALGALANMAVGAGTASAQAQGNGPQHAQEVVDRYLEILNQGMASGRCDFSALSTVYKSDARLTLTGGPFAPGDPAAFQSSGAFAEQQYEGIDAIIGFYTRFCGFTSHIGVAQWTQDGAFLLAPNALNSYEHVSFNGHLTGRCMHVFSIQSDKIASLDWTVYG